MKNGNDGKHVTGALNNVYEYCIYIYILYITFDCFIAYMLTSVYVRVKKYLKNRKQKIPQTSLNTSRYNCQDGYNAML